MVTSILSCIPVGLRAVLGTALSLIGSPSWGHGHGTLGSGTFLVYGSPRVSAVTASNEPHLFRGLFLNETEGGRLCLKGEVHPAR